MDRFFEKISYEQFKKDISNDKKLYEEYKLPERKTETSVGYDFLAINDFSIKPHEILRIPTGVKAKFLSDEMLMIVVRSSMGFKYNVRLTNQVGVIESDYYNNPDNEGHMWVSLQNEGEKEFKVSKGEAYAQGIFLKYLTCGEKVNTKRIGGFGSTNKKEGKKDE